MSVGLKGRRLVIDLLFFGFGCLSAYAQELLEQAMHSLKIEIHNETYRFLIAIINFSVDIEVQLQVS